MLSKFVRFLGLRGCLVCGAALVVSIVALQNMETADIDFLFWDIVEVPKIYLILGSFFVGAALGFVVAKWPRRSSSSSIS